MALVNRNQNLKADYGGKTFDTSQDLLTLIVAGNLWEW